MQIQERPFATIQLAGGASAEYRREPKRAAARNDAGLSTGGLELSTADKALLEKLQARDAEVRKHEAEHQAAAGGHAGHAHYTYQRGPDGKYYAIGGSVRLDTRAVSGSTEETIRKLESIHRSALAPDDPSGQDVLVALETASRLAQARQAQASEQEQANAARRAGDEASQNTPDNALDIRV